MKSIYVLFLSFCIAGCSMYFRWNPVLNGLEFEDELLFNTSDIGVHLKGFYVINVFHIGKIDFEFKNLTPDTIHVFKREFLLTLAQDTMHASNWSADSLILPPNMTGDFTVSFEYSLNDKALFNGTQYYLPADLEVTLLPVSFFKGNGRVSMPSIGFRPKERGDHNKKIEFAN